MRISGRRLSFVGIILVILPVLIALIGTLFGGGSMFNEGSGSGAILWLLVISIPLGGLILLSGGVISVFARLRNK